MNHKKRLYVAFVLCAPFCQVHGAQQMLDHSITQKALAILTLTVVSLLDKGPKNITIEANPTDTVQHIHNKIEAKTGFSADFQQLTFKEVTLDRHKKISDYGIAHGATLFMGKLDKGIDGFDLSSFEFSNLQNQQEIQFAKEAPRWRILCRGLNLEGMCVNSACEAYQRKVWVQKGFGTFSLGEEICESVCPLCKKGVEGIKECGFFYCKYQIKGCKVNDERVNIEDSHDSKRGFRKFMAGGEHSARYKYLKIIVDQHH